MTKPILHVSINSNMGYLTHKKFAQSLKRSLGYKYDIIFTPNDLVDIKADNMVTLKIDDNTNLNELIEKLNNMEFHKKEAYEQ